MDVDTRHLRALVAVVDEGTFTDAAIAMRTSQASISRSVQRVESVLGQPLLSRSSRHVELTAAGQRVLPHARRILTALGQLQEAAQLGGEDLRVGYAWAALGEHTVPVQRRWDREQQGSLVFVQSNTPTAGLVEGRCDVAVVRRPVTDSRLDGVVVGTEHRYAVLAGDHPLADRTALRLPDFAGLTVAIDVETGTTTEELWQSQAPPAEYRLTRGVDEWLTLIASGRAVGMSSEATASQHPRPGVSYRLLDGAPRIPVWLIWWKNDPPAQLAGLIDVVRQAYERAAPKA